MHNHIFAFITALVSILLTLFLNGSIVIPGKLLPPFAKILHPVNGIWANAETGDLPQIDIALLPVDQDSKIIYTDRKVPHIYANNLSDLLFLQGYVEASDRLFQMDMIQRSASGKLSEIFGQRTIQIDKEKNRSDIGRAAEIAVESWKNQPEAIKLFDNYIRGVNTYIKSLSYRNYPIEFKLMNYHPEEWTLLKSAMVFKSMANVLTRKEQDIESSNLLALLGEETFHFLYPEGEDGNYPVIPYEKKYDFTALETVSDRDSVVNHIIKKQYYKKSDPNAGSNNWAITPQKSVSGKSILCNDPHLTLSLPSIWYEQQLMTDEFNAYGVSFPGIAGIMIGFNENIAWGETNVGQDVTDMFLIKYADETLNTYWLNGNKEPIRYVTKEIKVRGGKSILDTIRYTFWGPIIKHSVDGKNDVAMRWLPAKSVSSPDLLTFVDGMQSANIEEYWASTEVFTSPAQNFLCADRQNIGLRVNGILPMKENQDGRFLEWGDQKDTDWNTIIPRAQNPQLINPESGYLTSANQRSAGKDYPYYYTGKFEHFRNRIINRMLSEKDDFTTEDMKAMQVNAFSILAEDILPDLLAKSDSTSEVVQILSTWNYEYKADQLAPVLFEEWFQKIKSLSYDEILMYKDSMNIMIPEDWRTISLISDHCDHQIFDKIYTIDVETCTDIIRMALDSIEKKYNTLSKTDWGTYKPVTINHYARIPAFSRTGIKTDGVGDAINATKETFGPSWRMVVSLGDTVEGYGVYPGGQSGNPASPYYDNMIDNWANMEYFPLQFLSKKEIVQN